MKKVFFCMVLAMLVTIGYTNAQTAYYWFNSGKIFFNTDSNYSYLEFKGTSVQQVPGKSKLASLLKVDETKISRLSDKGFIIASRLNEAGIKQAGAQYAAALLTNKNSMIIILPHLIVQMRKGHQVSEILALYNGRLSLLENKGGDKYLLGCSASSAKEVLDLANALYEKSGLVNWSEPEFYSNYTVSTVDPLYNNQYYLRNTAQYGGVAGIDINVEPAWKITTGTNTLRVAVIDQGVENHEDINGRVLNNVGFTAGVTGGNGAPQNANALDSKGHGEACAGIIAATQNNNIGISGVAPNVQIVPINIFPNVPVLINGVPVSSATNAQIAAAIHWAWFNAASDVLSNSWGGGSSSSDIVSEIASARTQGRSGRGCPVVFAAGNNSPFTDVVFPGNLAGVITVGACNNAPPSGAIWYYSDRGASMDLVAPSGDVNLMGDVTTTDRMGANGYEAGNYTGRFGDTSAACPQVSGVAALMLSANPNLTETNVSTLLQNSATDMGTAGFDNTFGYGRVNACSAVRQALVMANVQITGNASICTGTSQYNLGTIAPDVVTWKSSNTSIATVTASGNPVTVSRVGTSNGVITLTATVTLPCGNLTYQKQVVIGNAVNITALKTSGPGEPTTYEFTATPLPGANYKWYVVGQVNNPQQNGTLNQFDWYFPCNVTKTIYCVITTSCGTATSNSISETGGCIRTLFTVSPNPATNIVTITTDKSSGNTPESSRFEEIRIYDLLGMPKLDHKLSSTRQARINIASLNSGTYLLEIISGSYVERHQLLIRK